MTELDKVIKGLECCIGYGIEDTPGCEDCPYNDMGDTCERVRPLYEDALALLKAQEPRVMTLEEVNALDWDYCYLEEERLPEKEYRLMCGEHILTCVTWPSITAAKITYGCDGYGKRWRCWTTRPTDEQRKAVKWE